MTTDTTTKLFPVIEIFGPTIQGEGALAGAVTHFVRFGGCDYACRWCDSAHAVVPKLVRENSQRMTAHEIVTTLAALGGQPSWVTLSGGNPALLDLRELVIKLKEAGKAVAVETQGTKSASWLQYCDQVTISPKPPSAGNITAVETVRQFITASLLTNRRMCLKVVVFDIDDLLYAERVHESFPSTPFYLSIGTYMGGLNGDYAAGRVDTHDTILERYRVFAEAIAARPSLGDARVLPQLHALIWPVTERGR